LEREKLLWGGKVAHSLTPQGKAPRKGRERGNRCSSGEKVNTRGKKRHGGKGLLRGSGKKKKGPDELFPHRKG